ncbi:DUF2637 domain-containing protein [Mycobacterium kansasii]
MAMPATGWSMRVTRVLAVSITFGVGAASFALSFTALRDLYARGHIPAGQAWLFPLMVDGAILLATLGVVVMAGDPRCRNDCRFFWLVLCGGAAVSIACNALHAVLPPDQPLNAWLRGFLAAVAPIWLLVTTHGLTLLLTRMRRWSAATPRRRGEDHNDGLIVDAMSAEAAGVSASGRAGLNAPASSNVTESGVASTGSDEPDALDAPADSRWHTVAAGVLEELKLKNVDQTEVTKVLHLSYERALPDREIGRRFGLDHHTVGKIIRAADARIRHEHQERMLAAS